MGLSCRIIRREEATAGPSVPDDHRTPCGVCVRLRDWPDWRDWPSVFAVSHSSLAVFFDLAEIQTDASGPCRSVDDLRFAAVNDGTRRLASDTA